MHLKRVAKQVIVVSESSCGVGYQIASAAAQRRARVVVSSQDLGALSGVVRNIVASGGRAAAFPADTSKYGELQRLAEFTVGRFGRFDSWINVIGTRLGHTAAFEAVVNGSMVALPWLRRFQGALINVLVRHGEKPEDMAQLEALTRAVRGFTRALRTSVEQVERSAVSVTLVQPLADNARIAPEDDASLVSELVLMAMTHVTRDVQIDSGAAYAPS